MKIEYSRLEIHEWICSEHKIDIDKESIVWGNKINVGVIKNYNVSSLKKEIIKITKSWSDKYNSEVNNNRQIYPKFIISNYSNNIGMIGVSNKGWLAPVNYFYGCIIQNLSKQYGLDKYKKYLNSIQGETIGFMNCNGDVSYIQEVELVSEELLSTILEFFLEPDKISEIDIKKQCYIEALNKGYIK